MTAMGDGALPKDLFFGAKDYSEPPIKVKAYRRQSVAQLRLLQENLGKAIGNLPVADSQGYMGYALEVVEGIAQDIMVQVAQMIKTNANAEQRYDTRVQEAAKDPLPLAGVPAHNAAVLSGLIPGS